MSKYTTQLRWICETYAPNSSKVKDIIAESRPKIFDFEYPIPEEHKTRFETNFIRHYYMREIGCETVALWKLMLEDSLNLIMPYYSKLYTAVDEIKPYNDIDMAETYNEKENVTENQTENFESNSNETGTINRNNTGNNIEKYSDTPMGNISNVENEDYLSSATVTDNTSNDKTQTNNEMNTRNKNTKMNTKEYGKGYEKKVTGKNSSESYSDLFIKYQKALISVDNEAIKALSDLFILIW